MKTMLRIEINDIFWHNFLYFKKCFVKHYIKTDNNTFKNSLIDKTYQKIQYLESVIQRCLIDKITIRKYFNLKQRFYYKKSTIYSFLKQIQNIWKKNDLHSLKSIKLLDKLILKSKRPKNIKYKYNWIDRKNIKNYFFNNVKKYSSIFKMNLLNTWIYIKQNLFNSSKFNNKKFRNISINTIHKILKADKRFVFTKKFIYKKKHPLRKWDIDIGSIQFDIKVLGQTENPFKKKIYLFDAKDEQSKLLFMKIITDQTTNGMIKVVKEMISFFESYGIKIKRVRTDNAMVFKQTNFVHNGLLNKMLIEKGIEHQFIPLNEPEANGVIERHHLTLDKEFIPFMFSTNSFDEFKKKIKHFVFIHNHKRFHKYSWMNENHIPINFLKKYL